MDESTKNSVNYRESHTQKGADYDRDILEAGDFNTYMAHRETEVLRAVIPKLFRHGVPRYLDFACGTGRVTSVVEELAEHSTGLDISDSMLAEARQKCQKTTFVVGDVTREALDIAPVELATAFRFFGNAESGLRHDVLDKLRDLIKPGGYLITNNHRNPYALHDLLLRLRGEKPETDLSYWKMKDLFEAHGFRLEQSIGIGLWVCRHSLRASNNLTRSRLRVLEPLSRLPFLSPICPNAVLVARRS